MVDFLTEERRLVSKASIVADTLCARIGGLTILKALLGALTISIRVMKSDLDSVGHKAEKLEPIPLFDGPFYLGILEACW